VKGKIGTLWVYLARTERNGLVVDLACLRSDITIVPFTDSLGPDALQFILNQTELTTMCVEGKGFDAIVRLKTTTC